jgi:SAM-dependent methyltransferase
MMEFNQEVYDLRPWYHDFAALGVQTRFPERFISRVWQMLPPLRRLVEPGYVEKGEKFSLRQLLNPRLPAHQINQAAKETYILPFMTQALEAVGSTPTCLDLFCADGYYTCHMARLRPDAVITSVDLDVDEIARAQLISRVLAVPQVTFYNDDVWEFVRKASTYDVVFCTGGLYHLREPRHFLEQLVPIVGTYLVVQSAITLETEDSDYFVSPAPGWRHGSRFTHAGLRGWLETLGLEIMNEARSELPGNARLCDRGSSYFLCRVKK